MSEDRFAPSISVQAHALLELARKTDHIKIEMERLCSRIGYLSQEYMIINEAMQHTIADMNGGSYPAPVIHQTFPELNHLG